MRSVAILHLALSLSAVGSTVASLCRPASTETTSAVGSTVSVDTSSATSAGSATLITSATASTAESSTETSASVTVSTEVSVSSIISIETSVSSAETSTSSSETTASSSATSTATAESSTETTASSTGLSTSIISTETSASSTTAFVTSTDASTTATTSTAAAPTFSMAAVGASPVGGKNVQSLNRDGPLVFEPVPASAASFSARPYTIDAQGRILNDQGFFLCGAYTPTNDLLDAPARVITCTSEVPMKQVFLTCRVGADRVKCSIPAVTCVRDTRPIFPPTCQAADGLWENIYFRWSGPGYLLHIGKANALHEYTPIELSLQAV